ncbi:hypothetical protein [Flavobacterium cerinum]|uniref:Uncharacterized protein n=1 Tax=Flavobacterium cerinum TaxID=2502784 RepID=A0ABY5ITE5_9FLAO|nr:hypothetical protein [Flavobacterium cerinum]UUC45560.1 hypothetical protein NOX80_18310 [Flavobacterium cerinum]
MEFVNNNNCFLMAWPTSSGEFKKSPIINCITPEENTANTGDRVIGFKNKSGQDRIYLISEILSESKSSKPGYKAFKAKVSLIQ